MNFWQGERVRLRGLEPEDAAFFCEWNQDSDMARYLDQVWFPSSLAQQQSWAERTATIQSQGDEFFFVIENEEGKPVGSIGSHDCNRRMGTFEYGVAIRREYQRRGYAREAILLLLRHFFDERRYQKVVVGVHGDNEASQRLHERLGFQLEGRLRRMVYTQGHYYDLLYYGLAVEEFHQAYPGLATLDKPR